MANFVTTSFVRCANDQAPPKPFLRFNLQNKQKLKPYIQRWRKGLFTNTKVITAELSDGNYPIKYLYIFPKWFVFYFFKKHATQNNTTLLVNSTHILFTTFFFENYAEFTALRDDINGHRWRKDEVGYGFTVYNSRTADYSYIVYFRTRNPITKKIHYGVHKIKCSESKLDLYKTLVIYYLYYCEIYFMYAEMLIFSWSILASKFWRGNFE